MSDFEWYQKSGQTVGNPEVYLFKIKFKALFAVDIITTSLLAHRAIFGVIKNIFKCGIGG